MVRWPLALFAFLVGCREPAQPHHDQAPRLDDRRQRSARGEALPKGEPEPAAPSGIAPPAASLISAGDQHACAVTSDRGVSCWGGNGSGQTGDSVRHDHLRPRRVPELSDVVEVAAGARHTCTRLADGTARCWGDNFYGQLGDGTKESRATPKRVVGLAGAVKLTAGMEHTCALLADGTARCWGENHFGQLGDGTTLTDRTVPTTVRGLAPSAAITAGEYHTCARLTDGRAACWGSNQHAAIGDGTRKIDRPNPTVVAGLSGVAELAAGSDYTCARLRDGSGWCWGAVLHEPVEEPTFDLQPVPIATLVDVAEIAIGMAHTCARFRDRTVRCWGRNYYGELGTGGRSDAETPQSVLGLSGVLEITLGDAFSCARLADQSARCWGGNANGQLGDGTTTNRTTPVPVVW